MTTPPSPRQPTAAKLGELVAKWRAEAYVHRNVTGATQNMLGMAYGLLSAADRIVALLGDSDAVCDVVSVPRGRCEFHHNANPHTNKPECVNWTKEI